MNPTQAMVARLVAGARGAKAAVARARSWWRMRARDDLIAADLGATAPGGHRVTTLVARSDLSILRLDGLDSEPVIVKIAWSPQAAVQIEREAEQLEALEAHRAMSPGGPEAVAVPTLVQRGAAGDWPWVAQTLVPGSPTPTADRRRAAASIPPALAAIARFHAGDARLIGPDEIGPSVRRIVHEPLATIAAAQPNRRTDTEVIAATLVAAISAAVVDRPLRVGRVHGDYSPANVLWDESVGKITAIVDWESSTTGLPPEIDLVHFALAATAEATVLEYGTLVARCCRGDWSLLSAEANAALAGLPNGWPPATAVVIAWAHHVAANLNKAARYRTNRYWLRTNVVAVLDALTPATVST